MVCAPRRPGGDRWTADPDFSPFDFGARWVFAMDMRKFILFTAIGDGLWNFLLMSAGYILRSEYGRVRDYLGPLASAVLLCVAMAYAIRLLTWKKG